MAYSSEFTKQVLANKKNNTQNITNYESDYTKSVLNKSYTPTTTIDINTIRNEQIKNNNSSSKGLDLIKSADNWKDGYQFGDILKTAGSTALDLGTSLVKAPFSIGESIGDLAQYGVAQVADWLGADNFANQVRENAKFNATETIFSPAEELYNKNSIAGDTSNQIAEGIGYIAGIGAGGGLLPKAAQSIKIGKFALPTTSIVSGMGNSMTEAYNNDASDGEAWSYGALSGLTEAFSESLFGGLGNTFKKVYGGGALDDVIVDKLTKNITNRSMRILAQSGLKAVGEGTEEIVSGLGSALAKKMTYMSEENLGKLVNDEKLLDQFIMGTLTSLVAQTPSTVQSVKTGQDYVSLNNQDLSQNKTNINQVDQNIETLPKYSEMDENNVNNNVLQSKHQYMPTNNTKINNFNQTVAKYNFDGSQKTIDMVNTINKVIQDKGYNVLFDDTIVNKLGNPVNAQIKTVDGEVEIRINPNSPRATEFLLTHEITHAIETDSMKKLILDYASKNTEFNQSLESLKQAYGVDDVSSEVVADISGQLFGNQEFINSLSLEQPSIFKKIYNKIIEFANKITGNSNEALFIKDLKNKWETAYRNTTTEQAVNNLENKVKHSIIYNNDGSFNRVKINDNVFENNGGKSINQTIHDYIKEHIGEMYTIIESGQKVYLGEDLPGEYTYSKSAQSLPTTNKLAKGRAASNFKEIVENVNNRKWEKSEKAKHKKDAKYGFYKYDTTFSFDYNGNEKVYTGTVLIRNAENGKKYLYDILNIRPQKKLANLPPVASNSNKSLARFGGSSNQLANNISQSNNVVKSDTLPKYSMQENANNTQELYNSSFSLKQKQLDIILKNNPVQDDYHTWIRTVDDIKTLEETIADSDWADYDEFNPDLTKQDIEDAINSGKIMVYSSYPIGQGIFVSPSRMEAESYSSDGKVYSKEVNIDDVAWIDPTQGQYAKVNEEKYSQSNPTWQEYLEKNYKATGTRTNMQELRGDKLPTYSQNNTVQESSENSKKKTLNPTEISKLVPENASTTPALPKANVSSGKRESSFYKNVTQKSKMLSEESRQKMESELDIQFYKEVSNKESLEKAYEKLNTDGMEETFRWFNKKSENATDVDVAEGWILMKQYQDSGDYDSMVQVAKKMREMGTKAGQTVQAFNIMQRLTPEGMVKYAQSELSDAFEVMSKNKTKEWIDKYRTDFDLSPNEVQFIIDTMQEIQQMKDGYDKKVKLAEIQKLMTDKLPPEKGAGIKSWMRISMLFNPKTQSRNVLGNAVIAPVNMVGDKIASAVDKAISKKTGVRTTGSTNLKNYTKGFKTGLYQSYNDFKKGINTRNIEGNRFEISQGKSFNNKTSLGKSLNKVDSLLSFMLDAGDRGFYEASFTNSINNQLILNNTTEVTQEMIDIATQEALSRTWQDNNGYTKFVLNIRKGLNALHVPGQEGYGLGDILIPFAKTPANLTKAIVDYSPAGLINTITSGINLKRSLNNGQYNAQMQHQFVQNLGKATAGTMLYILGYALAKAGIATGESDEDKDVANFMKNTLGTSQYSIKIGNKTFTYDWAQPVAAPFAMMSNLVQKQKENTNLLENITTTLDTGLNVIFEQSFLSSLSNVLSESGEIGSKLGEQLLELPSRAIPTLSKQIADLTDETQRQSFAYGKPLETALNKVKAKIPGLSQTLAPSVDTLGREIKKYGGKNNIFNVFLNPANVNSENISESAKEIYRVYKETGDSTVMPRQVAYYINTDGEKIILTNEERAEYQKISGTIIEENVKKLLTNSDYKKMSDEDKAAVINNIVNYSYNKAREDVLNIEMSKEYNTINKWLKCGGSIDDYYVSKDVVTRIKETYAGSDNSKIRKQKIYQYINSLNCSKNKKIILFNLLGGYSIKDFKSSVFNYINDLKITKKEKEEIWNYLYGE